MYYSAMVPLLLAMSSSASGPELVDECMQFVAGMDNMPSGYGVDYDTTYSGSIREIGSTLDSSTHVQFGERSLQMPFVGREKLVVNYEGGTARLKHGSGRAVASYYDSVEHDDVVEYVTGKSIAGANPFEDTVLHEWLAAKGFEYTTEDLDCDGPAKEVAKTMAFLAAKASLSGEGSTVYRLDQFEIGLIQIRWNLAVIMVLEEGRVFYLTFEAKKPELIQDWIRQ